MRYLVVLAVALLALAGCGGSDNNAQGTQSGVNPAQFAATQPTPAGNPQDPAVAMAALQAGNARYVAGTNQALNRSVDRPLALNSSQAPEAVIIGCADSRVAPELAFDQPWGSLFVCRVAGNVAEQFVVGSTEYAVSVLNCRLIVILAHEQCGAVKAAQGTNLPPGPLGALVQLIVPAAQSVVGQPGDPLENAIIANAKLQAQTLQNTSTVINSAVGSGQVKIVSMLYTFQSGQITLIQ